MNRFARHLICPERALRRAFPVEARAAITAAIADAERSHGGEIRFAVETAFDLRRLWAGTTPRERALEVFANLGVWDTAGNNGVLIYLLLAERDIEIVADRGYAGLVQVAEWEQVCRRMEAEFRAARYPSGAVAGIREVAALIARHFPPRTDRGNELPDTLAII